MNSINSNSNFQLNPLIIASTILVIVLLLLFLSKLIERYKSYKEAYLKVDTMNKKLIKNFHDKNIENLDLLKKTINNIRTNGMDISFSEYVKIQELGKDILNESL